MHCGSDQAARSAGDSARMESDASSSPAPGRTRRVPAFVPWAIFAGWLVGTAFAFWQLEWRDIGRFESASAIPVPVDEAQRWYASQRPATTSPRAGDAVVVQVVDAECRCNSYNDAHVTDVRERLRDTPVEFRRVERHAGDGLAWIASTPAAMVFDAEGRLAYFGPWSDSAWCGSDARLVEPVVERLLHGETVLPAPVVAGGCFCHPERRS
jgi:hypothetical protein